MKQWDWDAMFLPVRHAFDYFSRWIVIPDSEGGHAGVMETLMEKPWRNLSNETEFEWKKPLLQLWNDDEPSSRVFDEKYIDIHSNAQRFKQ